MLQAFGIEVDLLILELVGLAEAVEGPVVFAQVLIALAQREVEVDELARRLVAGGKQLLETGDLLAVETRLRLGDLSTLRSAYPADLATGVLVGQPFLQVLERQQVDRFFDERELSEAEIYDADQRPVFDQLGVEYLILGTCSIRPDGMVLSLRTVEVLTGEVIASARAEAPSVEKAVDAAVVQLTRRMAVLFRTQDG